MRFFICALVGLLMVAITSVVIADADSGPAVDEKAIEWTRDRAD